MKLLAYLMSRIKDDAWCTTLQGFHLINPLEEYSCLEICYSHVLVCCYGKHVTLVIKCKYYIKSDLSKGILLVCIDFLYFSMIAEFKLFVMDMLYCIISI